jgi:membrane protein
VAGPPRLARHSLLHPSTLKEVVREYWAHRPMELAAALSYYTLLSLAPLVLMAVALAGLVFERAAVERKLVAEMRDLVGAAGAEVTQAVLRSAHNTDQEAWSLTIGLVILLVGATTVFAQLQGTLNRIWRVDGSAGTGASAIWGFLKERLLSIAMVLAIGFLLLVSLIVSAALSAVTDTARGIVGEGHATVVGANALGSLIVTTLLFALIFKVLPDADVAWDDVWFGAVTTSVLFTLGKQIIGLYLGRASVGSAYGAAGSLVVMTVWVFYASLILFFGAELTYVRSRRRRGSSTASGEHGLERRPAKDAVVR